MRCGLSPGGREGTASVRTTPHTSKPWTNRGDRGGAPVQITGRMVTIRASTTGHLGYAQRVTQMYSDSFYQKITPGSVHSARQILPIVLNKFPAKSMVDFGCGSGAWLSVAKELGVGHVLGIDGPWAMGSDQLLLGEEFMQADLAKVEPSLPARFDIAMSTEVAEHLPESRAESFIDGLCAASDCVIFSAAVPRQGGVNHVNEQWQSYWAAKFSRRGYGAIDLVRPLVWTDDTIGECYRQNLLVYVKGAAESVTFMDVLHPFYAERGLARKRGRLELIARAVARSSRTMIRSTLTKRDSRGVFARTADGRK